MVARTAEHARKVSELAVTNTELAERGGSVIGRMIMTIEDIRASSSRISDITGVIDGIAFQTNILALNAAVEAARAGDAGRGFAVVASEVRALAQRSASAAHEIKALIQGSVAGVEQGSAIVGEAGAAMSDIVGSSTSMQSLLAEIAASASQQSEGVSAVGRSVQGLDSMTQQNAAMAEQTAAASTSLREQSRGLLARVSQFRVPGG